MDLMSFMRLSIFEHRGTTTSTPIARAKCRTSHVHAARRLSRLLLLPAERPQRPIVARSWLNHKVLTKNKIQRAYTTCNATMQRLMSKASAQLASPQLNQFNRCSSCCCRKARVHVCPTAQAIMLLLTAIGALLHFLAGQSSMTT
eukprot:5358202-Pleurochrysis_carterae.AAC.1